MGSSLMLIGGLVYGGDMYKFVHLTHDKIVRQTYEFLERNLIAGTHKDGLQYSFSMCQQYGIEGKKTCRWRRDDGDYYYW
jgi:hypothetical protein